MLQRDDAGYVVGGAGGDSERGICRGASGGDCTAAVFLSAVAGRMPLERRDGDWNGFVRIVLAKLLAPMCRLRTRARSPG